MARPVIGFLSDFGLDGAAAICRAVMLSIAPDAQIVDISHVVRKFSIQEGAYVLASALPWFPVGVHLAVVDPGVGTARRAVAIQARRGDILVGPDNGILRPAADRLGGIVAAREIRNEAWMLPERSDTFHGRDVFAPVTAHLAAGSGFEEVGPPVDESALVALDIPTPVVRDGELQTAVIYVDSFGNLRLAGGLEDLSAAIGGVDDGTPLEVSVGVRGSDARVERTRYGRTFGDGAAGEAVLYRDSSGNLAFAEVQGDAARRIGAATGDVIRIRRA